MSDADCTPGREPRSVAASFLLNLHLQLCIPTVFCPLENAVSLKFRRGSYEKGDTLLSTLTPADFYGRPV